MERMLSLVKKQYFHLAVGSPLLVRLKMTNMTIMTFREMNS